MGRLSVSIAQTRVLHKFICLLYLLTLLSPRPRWRGRWSHWEAAEGKSLIQPGPSQGEYQKWHMPEISGTYKVYLRRLPPKQEARDSLIS